MQSVARRLLCLFLLGLVCTVALYFYLVNSPRLRQTYSSIEDSVAAWTGKAPVWTPEQISADPGGYARYAQERIRSLSDEFDANVQRVRNQVVELSALIHENDAALNSAQDELERLCNAYVRARDAGSWPVSMAGRSFDEEALKNAIGLVQWQVEQRENLRQRIQREYERKQMEAGRLELTVSNIRLDQIALAGTAEELRVQETMQNIQQLEDMVHAAADKGTESLVRDLTEARDALLTDEELDRLLADAAQGSPTASAAPLSDPALGHVPSDTPQGSPTVFHEPPAGINESPQWNEPVASVPANQHSPRTLTPAQKDALGIEYDCPVPPVRLRKTPESARTESIRSDHGVPLLPPPVNRHFH